MYIHAERLLAKAGRQGARGGESPILGAEAKLERKGRSAAEVCTSEARKTAGNPLRRARAEPSAKVWYPLRARCAHISIGDSPRLMQVIPGHGNGATMQSMENDEAVS
ncbi:MAG TPA: hypothetical protein VK638_58305, partial [Edaphobacter sp.]|nr:hypothetical protein [Edaphobacter sp.]